MCVCVCVCLWLCLVWKGMQTHSKRGWGKGRRSLTTAQRAGIFLSFIHSFILSVFLCVFLYQQFSILPFTRKSMRETVKWRMFNVWVHVNIARKREILQQSSLWFRTILWNWMGVRWILPPDK